MKLGVVEMVEQEEMVVKEEMAELVQLENQ
jgi:hypothetical protein